MTVMTGSAIRLAHNNTVVDGVVFEAVPPKKSEVPQSAEERRARRIGMISCSGARRLREVGRPDPGNSCHR
jgi:hypothetical protein